MPKIKNKYTIKIEKCKEIHEIKMSKNNKNKKNIKRDQYLKYPRHRIPSRSFLGSRGKSRF